MVVRLAGARFNLSQCVSVNSTGTDPGVPDQR